jgi:predicted LPLAT superfamily acyltransferase
VTVWNKAPERGAGWLVTLMLWLLRHVGWFARGIVLPGISAWFFVSSPKARAASRDFLGTALGRPARARDVLHHIHVFASAILDRTLMLIGPSSAISLEVNGLHLIESTIADGRGCVLLGAHLGSFAVLRQLAEHAPVPVRMLMHRDNAGAFTRAMEALDPALRRDTIQIGDVQSMLRAHEAVASGAIVGVLADRAPAGSRQITVPFFGRPAGFPAGPFVLAASLGAPVLLFSGVRTGHRRYAVTFEPFAEKMVLRRATRQADLFAAVSRYAAWLEGACRAHPFNWFNFYPFWERAPHAPTQARPQGEQMGAASRSPVGPKPIGSTAAAR